MIPAVILAQPQGVAIPPGSMAVFSVTAYSPSPLQYQWRFNGTNLPGQTTSALVIPNVQPVDIGDYTVTVSDPISSITSDPASLIILAEPFIVVHPVSQSALPGGPIVLSLTVTNTATLPIGVRIRRNSISLPASPSTFFTINTRTFFLTLSGTNAAPPWTNYALIVTNRVRTSGLLSSSALITYLTDVDGDGLADTWETNYFGGLSADPALDSDGDGMNNRDEFIAGTDPTNRFSYLKIDAVSAPPEASVRFLAVANRTYTIQFTDALGTLAWQKLADVVARATDRVETVADPAYRTNRVYRLLTPQQP
jgi:hypothetical protein